MLRGRPAYGRGRLLGPNLRPGGVLSDYVPPTPAIPVFTVNPALSGSGAVGGLLTCSTGTLTGYPSPTFSYDWQKNAVSLGAPDQNTYSPVAGDNDGSITCVVTATNSEGSDVATSDTVIVTYPPAFTVDPVISGNVTVGSVLTVTPGTAVGAGTLVRSYQWKIDGANVGTDQAPYTLLAGDDGGIVSCEVTVTGDDAPAAVFTTPNYGTVIYPPANTVLPVISGTSQDGETLTVTTGTWVGDGPFSYSYQWQIDGVNVGTDQNTYLLVTANVGGVPTCEVTAIGDDGSTMIETAGYTVVAAAGGAPALLIDSTYHLLIDSGGNKLLIGAN